MKETVRRGENSEGRVVNRKAWENAQRKRWIGRAGGVNDVGMKSGWQRMMSE